MSAMPEEPPASDDLPDLQAIRDEIRDLRARLEAVERARSQGG